MRAEAREIVIRSDSARNPFGVFKIAFSPGFLVDRVPQPFPRLFPARARSGCAPPPRASTSNWADLAEMRHRGRLEKYLWSCCCSAETTRSCTRCWKHIFGASWVVGACEATRRDFQDLDYNAAIVRLMPGRFPMMTGKCKSGGSCPVVPNRAHSEDLERLSLTVRVYSFDGPIGRFYG